MRRVTRRLFGGAAAGSLAMAVAAGGWWVRSFWRTDSVGSQRCRIDSGSVKLIRAGVLSSRGTVEINIEWGTLDPGADRGAGLRAGWTAGHSARPAGPLMFHAIPARSLSEHLGVRVMKRNPGFVAGLLSRSATHVTIDVPHAGLVLLFLVLPTAWLAIWRRRRVRPGHCPRCGYDLTGNVSGKCSECGREIDRSDPASAGG